MDNALSIARGSQTYSAFESYDVGISWAVRRMFARLEGRDATIRRLLEENRQLRDEWCEIWDIIQEAHIDYSGRPLPDKVRRMVEMLESQKRSNY